MSGQTLPMYSLVSVGETGRRAHVETVQRVTLRADFRYQPNTLIRFVHLVGAGCP